jgi:hypothetical protein
MQETTVHLPEETNAALQRLAAQTGRSQTELIQAAIEDFPSQNQPSLPRSIGLGHSRRSDLSERDEELLWQET